MPQELRSLTALTLLASTLAAQTTWTSFEDRKGHAIASDPGGGVLMFGGESSASTGLLRGDTNRFANSSGTASWTQLNPNGSPTPRTEHAMASGTDGNDLPIFLLFGGLAEPQPGLSAVPSSETFVFNGSGWGHLGNLSTHPSARTGHAMLADTERDRIVLFGGYSGGSAKNDLWEFDPVNNLWLEIIPSGTPGSPPPRYDHAMAFHPAAGGASARIYLFGGTGFRFDTWELNPWTTPATWTNVTPTTRPPGRRRCALAYLPAFDNIIMFGGEDSTLTPLNDTWVWDPWSLSWSPRSPATTPPARFDHAMAPDQLGNSVVLLGGDNGTNTALEGTWLWNGVNWIEGLPPPSPRSGVAMAYDDGREMHPVFGGRAAAGGADLAETWELDGLNWHQRLPSNTPSPRADAGIAYDSARNRTVLFGGRSGGLCGTERGDTWEWDGQNWSPRAPANSPPASGGVQPVFDSTRNVTWMLVGSGMWAYDGTNWSMAELIPARTSCGACWDSVRNRLVVFGGNILTSTVSSDTWEWDETNWHAIHPPTSPPARRTHRMVYHEGIQLCLMVGGMDASYAKFGDVWAWDGGNWTPYSTIVGRSQPAVTYDHGRDLAMIFSGADWNSSTIYDLWEAGTTSWQHITTGLPHARAAHAMAYDRARNRAVVFGGHGTGPAYPRWNDTWEHDGSAWAQKSPAAAPSARTTPAMCFDSHTGKVLLFGGYHNAWFGDTWTWDGTTWTQLAPASSPSPRSSSVMFSTGTRTLLFSGGDSSSIMSDLWEWDGTTWTLLDSGTPSSRTNYGAAYDARRDRVVVFGGREDCASGDYLSETWEWDGDSWLQRFPTNAPSPRERSKLTYDESRGLVVLFGGTDGTNTFSDTWEWDGTDWTLRLPVSSPPGSSGHGLSFDSERNVTVGFGEPGTWDYGPTSPALSSAFGTGCTSSAGVPTLSPKPWAGPWLGDRVEIDILNQPPGLGIFVWGFSNTSWLGIPLPLDLGIYGSPGCYLLVDDLGHEILSSGTNPYVSFVWPNYNVLLGAKIFCQAGFFDAGQPGFPIVTTNALEMTFGRK